MISRNDPRQGHLIDPWEHLSPKRRQLLENSWAGLFRQEILVELPVDQIAPWFRADFGRPSKELYTVLGFLVLQQMHDLTDADTVQQLAFHEQWHYALNIAEEGDAAKYMCPKTLWNIRKKVTDQELDTVLFDQVTEKLARVFQVDPAKQRLDSVHTYEKSPTCVVWAACLGPFGRRGGPGGGDAPRGRPDPGGLPVVPGRPRPGLPPGGTAGGHQLPQASL